MKIPFFLPEIKNEDKKIVVAAMSNSSLTDGPKLKEFEKIFNEPHPNYFHDRCQLLRTQ